MAVESIDDLKVAVCNLVRQASGVNAVIEAYPDHSPPEGLYGTYNMIPVRAYGHAIRERGTVPAADPAPPFVWEDIVENTVTQLELMVSINFLNAGAKEAAHKVLQSQFRHPIRWYCRDNSLGWRFVSEVRNLTGMEQATLQERYQLDLHLWVETQVSDTILAAAGFSVELYDEDERLLTTIDGNIGEG